MAATPLRAGDGWLTDYKEALAQAKKENRPVLMDFTGSDWCGWCMKLNKEVFSQAAFKDYAKANLVLLEVDFPRGKTQSEAVKKQNAELEQKFQIQGYPTIILVDANGNKIAEGGYLEGGPQPFIDWIKSSIKK